MNSKIVVLSITVLAVVAMVRLGFWQLDRAQFKRDKQQIIDTRINQPQRQLPAELIAADEWQYYRVKVQGEYRDDIGFVVDNVINQSVAGVNALTPFVIADSETMILVNRGWIEWGQDRTFLPNIDAPDGVVNLSGLLLPAPENPFYLTDPDDSGQPRQLWTQLDLQRFKNLHGDNVQPLIFLLDENQPGSFEHAWQYQGDTWIARHKAYAFQWFGLALTLTIIMAALGYQYAVKREKA